MNHFTQKSGSPDGWPPPDGDYENNSPYDEFTCVHCGGVFYWQTCGSFFIDMPSFGVTIKKGQEEHLQNCSKFYEKLKTGEVPETLQFHL